MARFETIINNTLIKIIKTYNNPRNLIIIPLLRSPIKYQRKKKEFWLKNYYESRLVY